MIRERDLLKGFGGGFRPPPNSDITITIINRKQ